MIDLKVTYDDGRLTVHNVGETDTDVIWLALIDIDSNLVKDMMWVAMPPNTYVEPPHSEAHPSANGYRIEAFYDDEEKETQFSAEIIWGEPNYKHYFNNPRREFGYGPYVDLFFNDEYDGEVVIGIDDVVYDLGANVGVFTMWALENGAKQIYSFEPTNYLRPYLYETFGKHHPCVIIYDKAITGKNEIRQFNRYKHSVGNSLYMSFDDKVDTVDVECINLEQFINENGLEQPTLIKVDIEGSEYEMFYNLSDEFISSVKTFIVEFHYNNGGEVNTIISKLLNLGFSIKMKKGDTLGEMGTFIAKK